jgi:peptide/nickel transport system ATP-binding protein
MRTTLVLVTHDMGVHANLADRVAVLYAGQLVEEADTRTLLEQPRHPYTQYLIQSLPRLDDRAERVSIPGRPPALDRAPPGCRFHPRCPLAMDVCATAAPALEDEHEILTVAGESGSGKTTLARMILGLIEPSSGRLIFKDRDITRLSGGERRTWFRREVQPVFQDPFATFNPLRRIDAYLYETAANFGVARGKRANEPIENALAAVGLSLREVHGRYPNELSGGQLQRVSIARALITNPSLLVADEPVSMLDASLRMSVVNLFRELKARQSVVYITHDLATAYYASDRVAIMLRGWIVEIGPVHSVLGEPMHPYTKLLKQSVLEPELDNRSTERIVLSVSDTAGYLLKGCRFADRCPAVMDICHTTEPADIAVDGRVVKCHLYGAAPT